MRSYVALFVLVMGLFALAQDKPAQPSKYTLTETQQLKLQAKQKDAVILQQKLQLLQVEYNNTNQQLQQTVQEYQALADQIKTENKWTNAQFNYQTGQFEEKPAPPPDPKPVKEPAKK